MKKCFIKWTAFHSTVQGRHGSGHFLGKDDSCDTTWPST